MRATSANLESIFSIYSDEEEVIVKVLKAFTKRKPVIEATDKDRVTHRLFKIDRKSPIDKIIKEMKDKFVFIADGHHRYEAALRYKNELKIKNTKFSEDEAYNHIMMYFTPMEGSGLVILPIHRAVKNLVCFDPITFEENLNNFFDIETYKCNKKSSGRVRKQLLRNMEKRGKDNHTFGLYMGGNHYYLLTLKDINSIDTMLESD